MAEGKLSESFQAWNEKRRDEVTKAADQLSQAIVDEPGEVMVDQRIIQLLAHALRSFMLLMHSNAIEREDEIPEDIENDIDNVEHMIVMLAREINGNGTHA